MKHTAGIVLIVTIFFFLVPCTSCHEEPNLSDNKTGIAAFLNTLPESSEEILTNRVSVSNNYTRLSGTSTLPNGTVLVSKLFQVDTPLPWWPEEQEIIVKDGEWEIFMYRSVNVTYSGELMLPVDDYHFYIWKRENPTTKSAYYFDLYPPPENK